MSDDAPGAIPDDMPFEDAMAELEECVDRLESGDAGLDEAVRLFQRGAALQAWCEARLDAISAQIEELTGAEDADDQP
jgi:exodeoxyribonuclease VII small subunit